MLSISPVSSAPDIAVWSYRLDTSCCNKPTPAITQEGLQSQNREKPLQSQRAADPTGRTETQKRALEQLKKRDQAVKAHEQAHLAAGGPYIRGGATYSYQQGPDGKLYAIGGEVSIDTSVVSGNPRATIQKMQTVQRAALAPADPSGQDLAVAAAAAQVEAKAQQELSTQQAGGGLSPGTDTGGNDTQPDGHSGSLDTGSTASYPRQSAPILGYSNQGKALRSQAHRASLLNYVI